MTSIHWLDPDNPEEPFPDCSQAFEEPNGLLAAGGDLSLTRLRNAYQQGIFPWYSENQPILWWTPNPRLVLFPQELKISRSLRKSIRTLAVEIRFDTVFRDVIRACSESRATQSGTWILPQMQAAYVRLHQAGLAHSVEVWQQDHLIGGLYGVAMGRVFFGESMFHRVTDASKIAFYYLVQFLTSRQFALIDCQVRTNHLVSLGAREIPRTEFLQLVMAHRDFPDATPWPHYLPPTP